MNFLRKLASSQSCCTPKNSANSRLCSFYFIASGLILSCWSIKPGYGCSAYMQTCSEDLTCTCPYCNSTERKRKCLWGPQWSCRRSVYHQQPSAHSAISCHHMQHHLHSTWSMDRVESSSCIWQIKWQPLDLLMIGTKHPECRFTSVFWF